MRCLKVCHLASFTGNLGDSANHDGFKNGLRGLTDFEFDFTELEMREFYWSQRKFDSTFVDYINQFDLLIIGGGNYFELWVEGSPTGTSVAVPLELLPAIRCPIIFNALGVDPGQGVPEGNKEKFRSFIDRLKSRGDLISVRNDGALAHLLNVLGPGELDGIYETVDAGFFVTVDDTPRLSPKSAGYIALNIACDMAPIRFKTCSLDATLRQLAESLVSTLSSHSHLHLVLVPHIYSDLQAINLLLELLPDPLRRTRVEVAPLHVGSSSYVEACKIYRDAALVLANRFHANVCAIGLGAKTLGLINYVQIENLYGYLGTSDYVDIRKDNFSSFLTQKIETMLNAENLDYTAMHTQIAAVFNEHISNINHFLKDKFSREHG